MSTGAKWFGDSNGKDIPLIHIGKVVSVDDPNGTGAIRVRIDGIDKLDSDRELPPALPLIPKFLNIYPEVGQAVFVFQYKHKEGLKTVAKSKRYWIGPIVSQLQKLENEEYKSALSQEPDGYSKPDVSIDRLKEADGAYPKKEDIALQGRDNTDIIFKPREVRIRAGKWKLFDKLKYNDKDPAYIQLKYSSDEIKKEWVEEKVEKKVYTPPTHVITIYADSFIGAQSLGNNASDSEYSNSDQTIINITVRDVNNPDIEIPPINETFTGDGSRLKAIKRANELIDSYMSQYPKWKIFSPVREVLDKYGKDGQSSRENKIVLYPNNTVTRQETKKVLKIKKESTGKEGSVINVVASKINLISHDGEHTFDLTDRKDLITSETQNTINSEAHPLVYGDKLVEFLNLVKNYIRDHEHPFDMKPAIDAIEKTSALDFDLETILNKNINSN